MRNSSVGSSVERLVWIRINLVGVLASSGGCSASTPPTVLPKNRVHGKPLQKMQKRIGLGTLRSLLVSVPRVINADGHEHPVIARNQKIQGKNVQAQIGGLFGGTVGSVVLSFVLLRASDEAMATAFFPRNRMYSTPLQLRSTGRLSGGGGFRIPTGEQPRDVFCSPCGKCGRRNGKRLGGCGDWLADGEVQWVSYPNRIKMKKIRGSKTNLSKVFPIESPPSSPPRSGRLLPAELPQVSGTPNLQALENTWNSYNQFAPRLKSCEPEFVIATPERLQELVSCNAINISGVSLLVVDGPSYEIGSIDAIKTIRQIICGSLQTVVFSDCSSNPYISVLQKLIQGSFCRIPLESLTHER
nr:probable ATP-dependent RNA helicase ddx5 [Ipomoea batatas]